MFDKRPAKGKRDLVVKCNWVTPCVECWSYVEEACTKEDRLTPSLEAKEFLVPYYCFDWRCEHSQNKPFLFESSYARRSETPT